MPYKSEQMPIAGTKLDLRAKLSRQQKEAIKDLAKLDYSQRQLAEMFGCSRRSIQNILHPEPRGEQPKRPKEYWTQKKREYRQRKQALYLDGKLSTKNKSKNKSKNGNNKELDSED